MKILALGALSTSIAAFVLAATPASAGVTISSTPGAAIYVGPTPTFDFESPAPFSGLVTNVSLGGVRAQPFGSSGNFATVGPSDGSPGILNLAAFGAIDTITFLWGSVDEYNTLDVLDAANNVFASFTGTQVSALANGNQTSPFTNPLVTLTFTGLDRNKVSGLQFSSGQNAFEFDNVSIATAPVPEPATWMMMILGFGLIGGLLRKRTTKSLALT